MTNHQVHDALRDIALAQDGVVSRAQADRLGLSRSTIASRVTSGRWRAYGAHAVAIHPMPLSRRAQMHVSLWEAGTHAVLDGASSLEVAGLRNFEDVVHILVPWPHGGRSWEGSRIHNSRLWDEQDFVVRDGLPCTRPAVAAVRAALWARTKRAAATVLAMTAQQGLAGGGDLLLEARRVNRHKKRPFVLRVATDIADGAQSLGELDFVDACRRRGLPTPVLQAVTRGPRGRVFRDAHWPEFGVTAEIEGVHHDAPEHAIDDSLRQNELTIGRDAVLRVPLLGWRVSPGLYLDQVERCLTASGWRRTA